MKMIDCMRTSEENGLDIKLTKVLPPLPGLESSAVGAGFCRMDSLIRSAFAIEEVSDPGAPPRNGEYNCFSQTILKSLGLGCKTRSFRLLSNAHDCSTGVLFVIRDPGQRKI